MRLRGGIAIVGMGCRYPGGADTPSRFWDLLAGGVDAVTEVPPERAGLAASSRWGGFVEAIDQFDAGFFGISPREARRIDPQQRLLLEVAWEALEDAGQLVDRLAGSATGVFVGISGHDYADLQSRPDHRDLIDVHVNAGSATSIAANRISYQFDLRGPSVAVDTACSSALTALHLACASLDAGECDLALVGAVNALLTPEPSIGFAKAGMLSPTGRCRPFDAAADGYVRSEGAGVVVLKLLDDALAAGDPIYAVIRATGVNQDGRTPGITVPSPDAQQALMESVLADAGLSYLAVQYVEAHGTGTPVGDPREARAIGAVMAGRAEDRPCLVGSAKGNLGHLEAAAGMVGLMKAALALRHRQVPPSLHFTKPHPDVPFDELRLRVPTALEPWPATGGAPAVAGVNSFGFGGANAHVVLEEAPEVAVVGNAGDGHLLVLSAHGPEALRDLAGRWVTHLAGRADVADACFTAAARRTHHEYRLAVAGRSAGELRASLAAVGDDDMVAARRDDRPRLAFVFTGMGPLTAGVGRQMAACEPVFAAVIEECDRVLEPLAGWSLRDQLLRDDTDSFVTQPRAAHVANLALQLGLAALWRSWGVVPDAVAGHSSGEIAAACVAGAIDLAGAVTLAYHRGRLQQRKDGTGGMLAAGVGPADVAALVGADAGRVTLAAVNAPALVTLAGDLDALERIAATLDDQGRFRRMVPVTVPYHSPALDDLQEELEAAAGAVAAQLPTIPLASTVTGDWLNGRPLDPEYWWAGVRQPVQFAAAVDRLLADGCELVVEVGPHLVLAASVRECAAGADRPVTVLPSLRRGEPERLTMLRTLGALHAHGVDVDWTGLYGGGRRVVPLPTYPWQRSRHWMASAPVGGHPLLGRRLATARPTWENDLGDDRLAFLDGHLVQDRVALPAAAYVEACVAATAGDGPVALGPVEFHRLLAGDRAGTILQVTEVDGGVEVHSSPAGGEWTLRASARRLASPPPASGVVGIDAVRLRCRTVGVDELYGALAAAGLRYQGAFRPLAEVWAGDGEVLARLELPAAAGATDGWHVHPALLDGTFQAVAGVGVDRKAGAWLPVSIRRVEWYANPGATGWCHATVTRRDGRLVEADVVLTDHHGSVVVRCQGLRVQRVGAASAEDPSRWFFEERWEPAPRVAATTAADLASDVQPTVDEIAGRLGLSDFYDHVGPGIDALAVRSARQALAGLDPATVPDRHNHYLARLREIARTPSTPPPDPNVLAGGYPTYRSVIELVRESGERLAATLRGDDDARQWMVAGPWLDTLTELYGVNPGFRAYSEVAAGVVHSLWRRNGDRRLRILEVGAGTGGATGAILDRLPEGATDYLATDISPFFVKVLRHHFGQRAGVRTAVFDVEDPTLDEGPFDVIVAADVVHATADVERTLTTLRQRLAPGGALVLIEVLNRAPWLDLLFGQFEGWWRHADTVRPDHPLLDSQAWLDVLDRAGFEAAVVTDAGGADGTGPLQAVLVATLPRATTEPRPPHRWLVLTDRQGVGPEVAAALRESGDTCVLAWPGSSYRRYGADGFELVPEAVDDWARLREDAGPVDGVVHLWSLDPPPAHDGAGLLAFQATTCGSVTALFAAAGAPVPPLWLVTAGSPAGAPLWGMGRVVRSERGAGACRLVELGPDLADSDVAALVDELLAPAGSDLPESEVALRDGQRLAHRLEPAPALAGSGPSTVDLTPDTATFRVAATRPGALDSLVLREMPTADPGPGEVAVRLLAGALNFRDVLVALGIGFAAGGEDPAAAPLGWEGAGVVEAIGEGVTGVRPGDHVMAMAAGSLGSRVVTRAGYVVPLPTGLRPEEAATLPVAFLTARYALERLGRLAAGERVLIHAASGGVGLAAVQLARLAGAEVLATAGTPEKRDYLRSIGIEHVMDSRSLDFAAEVMAATGGEGVDVVLNSLAGEAAARSVEVLRPFGRFVEIGKRDIYEGGQLDLAPFRRNLSYLALDLQPLYDGQPELIESMLRELAADVDAGRIQPLPYKAFDLGRAEEAFRHMAQARHIGKVVLTVRAPAYPVVPLKTTRFRGDRTYVISGGLGGFGLAVAQWMVGEGAGHLALLSRSGEPRPEDQGAFDAVVATGAAVEVVRADVSRVDDLAAALSHARATMPPLAGVVHAAMVLDDGLLGTLDWPRTEAVLAPKVAGAWNLHEATAGDDLDLFVLFSSISAAIGQPGQASYAAANAFLDALATHRRSLGLPALSVAWGVISGAGYVSRRPDIQRRTARQGLLGITPEEACDALGRLLAAGTVRAVVSRGRWGAGVVEDSAAPPPSGRTAAATPSSVLRQVANGPPAERPGALERHLAEVAARVLEAPTAVHPERRLFDLGFDSLMAVELSTALRADLDVEVPIVDLLDDLTVRSLAERVLALLEGRSHG